MTTVTDTTVEVFTTPQRTHPDYQACVRVKQALTMYGIEYEEIHLNNDEFDYYASVIGASATFPLIRVSEQGEVVEKSFGYQPTFLTQIRRIAKPRPEELEQDAEEEQAISLWSRITVFFTKKTQGTGSPHDEKAKTGVEGKKRRSQRQVQKRLSTTISGLAYDELVRTAEEEGKSVPEVVERILEAHVAKSPRVKMYKQMKAAKLP